jgi:DnaK suppressor protein
MVIDKSIIEVCKMKLLSKREDLLNRLHTHRIDFIERETGGDEADQTVSLIAENHLFISQQRMRHQLMEVELALSRIEKGTYGTCEETQEPIETQRLLAIPWTRLSLEGAEIREQQNQRHA